MPPGLEAPLDNTTEMGPQNANDCVLEVQKHVPLSRIQRLIAKRMLASKHSKPCFYLAKRTDVTDLMAMRHTLTKTLGVKITSNSFFIHALALLGIEAGDALFVGDDPRWDVEGPRALGMRTALVDRTGRNPDALHGLVGLTKLL